MSNVRPECGKADPGQFSPSYADALYRIREAVRREGGLIAGKLDGPNDTHCAIGSYFKYSPQSALSTKIIDEVATYNDSIKTHSPRVRKKKVLEWLNFKLRELGLFGRRKVLP